MPIAPDVPYEIGQAAFGGYVAGVIDTTRGNIIAADASQTGQRYMLIVAPKSLETTQQWADGTGSAPAASRTRWDGLSATQAMDSLAYNAAQYCASLSHLADDASPWYLPAIDELELIYRNLKSTTESNRTGSRASGDFPGASGSYGENPSSDPVGAAYTSANPARTSAAAFRDGGGQDLGDSGTNIYYWTSTEYASSYAWIQDASGSSAGIQGNANKTSSLTVRPVRRILVSYLNTAPSAPVTLSPVGGASVDRSQPITLSAQFSDPEAGDSPSASQWRYRIVGAGTWTTVSQPNPLQTYTIAAGLAAGDYEWQAAYADQQGAWGPFSSSEFFTAVDPLPGPVWLDPAAGATIGTDSYTFVFSAPDVDQSEFTLYADDGAGNIDTSTILQGPVTVDTGDVRRHTFTGLANNVPVWASVRYKYQGLWSQPAQQRNPVSYTPPVAPVVSLLPDGDSGALLVTITNPTGTNGEPPVAYNRIRVNDGDGLDHKDGSRMVAVNSSWTYHLPVIGRDYEGNVEVTAVADNGVTATTTA